MPTHPPGIGASRGQSRSGGRGGRHRSGDDRRRQGQSRRAQGAAAGSGAHARRIEDRAGQGRARPVVHGHPRAGRRRVRQPRRARPATSFRPGSASPASCRSTKCISTRISRRRSSATCGPDSRVSVSVDALPEHAISGHGREPFAGLGAVSRCCRPTMRPAISPRSCSACRSASRCRATSRRNACCGPACRWSSGSIPSRRTPPGGRPTARTIRVPARVRPRAARDGVDR